MDEDFQPYGVTMKNARSAGLALVSLLALHAHAQQTDRVVSPAAVTGAIQPVDETFALYAASSGAAQVEGARLVLKTTRNDAVRDYAQRLLRDHTQAAEQLRRLVSARGVKLSPVATGRHADMVTTLAGVTPRDLDGAFLQRFGLDAHKETIALFERHANEGKDPELRRYAQQSLATLREHMAAAHKLIHAGSAR
jgi:putative membrane protein